MSKKLDMSGFDELSDDLEEFINKQGFTLGDKADCLKQILFYISFLYIQGIATESQKDSMSKKFNKMFWQSIRESEVNNEQDKF